MAGNQRKPTTTNTSTSSGGGREDRLSSLPDAIIAEILSLLLTKTAISTSVLSRRWHSLCCSQLSLLSFSGPRITSFMAFQNPSPEFLSQLDALLTTVDNLLCRLTSPKIVKFELIIDFPGNRDSDRCNSLVDSWVRRVCSRHPEHIAVIHHGWSFGKSFLNIPTCLFHCHTLVSLSLSDTLVYDSISDEASINNNIIPNLKKLEMWVNDSHWKMLGSLLKGCPILEELCLTTRFSDEGRVVEICFPNLKSLSLGMRDYIATVQFMVDAPRLESLSISSFSTWYRFVNNKTPSGLFKAKITMAEEYNPKQELFAQMFGLLEAVSSVRVLNINCETLRDFERVKKEGLLVFKNLTELQVEDFYFARLDQLLFILSCCPNLEVLVLYMYILHYVFDDECEEWVAPDIDPACLFTKLKVLELKTIEGTNYHLDFMEYVLRNGSVLEKLVVGVRSRADDRHALRNEFAFCHKLFSYPRNSSACEIKLCGRCITASSKGLENRV